MGRPARVDARAPTGGVHAHIDTVMTGGAVPALGRAARHVRGVRRHSGDWPVRLGVVPAGVAEAEGDDFPNGRCAEPSLGAQPIHSSFDDGADHRCRAAPEVQRRKAPGTLDLVTGRLPGHLQVAVEHHPNSARPDRVATADQAAAGIDG